MTWDPPHEDAPAPPPLPDAPELMEGPPMAPVPPPPPMQMGAHSWSAEQLERLENEWRRLQRNFAYHPHIAIRPLKGNPPDEYEVEYRLRTLVMYPGQPLVFAGECKVQIWLPPSFPHAAPVIQPVEPVFHPNVLPESIQLIPAWEPTTTLSDAVTAVGKLLALQLYDPNNPWNETAMQWVNDNPQYLPLDESADLTPQAGGEPIERICRLAPMTLDQIRGQFGELCESLLGDEPPADLQVRDFVEQTRLALNLFLENDIPDTLRQPASELDDAARELEASLNAWAALRAQRHTAAAAERIAGDMAASRQQLSAEMRNVSAQVAYHHGPVEALLKQIPPLAALQADLGRIEGLIVLVEKQLADAKPRLAALDSLPSAAVPGTGLVGQRLDAQKAKAGQRVEAARVALVADAEQTEAVLAKARQREAAVRRMMEWREYRELVSKARDLLERVGSWGAAGVEAYFIQNDAGSFGPFPFEQELSLGSAAVAVRNLGPTEFVVLKASNGQAITRTEDGKTSISVRDTETGQRYTTTFRMTARCDELIVQLGYLAGETRAAYVRACQPVDAGDCSLGKLHAALTSAEARRQLEQEQGALEKRCRATADDLEALAPFKERLATYGMVQRMRESVPKMKQKLADAKKTLAESTKRIEQIAKASNANVDTGQLQIPAKFAKEYPQRLVARDQAIQRINQLTKLLQVEAEALSHRLESPELLGYAIAPQMHAIAALPEELVQLQPAMTTDAMLEAIDGIGREIGRTFTPADAHQAHGEPASEATQAEAADEVGFGAPEEAAGDEHAQGAEAAESGEVASDDSETLDWGSASPAESAPEGGDPQPPR